MISPDQWIDEMIADEDRFLCGAMKYFRVIAAYQSYFGNDNVGMFLYERLFREVDEMYRFARFFGIDPFATAYRFRLPPVNVASDHAFKNLARRINGRFHASTVFPREWIDMVVYFGSKIYRGRKIEFTDAQRWRIARFFGRDNARTARLLGRVHSQKVGEVILGLASVAEEP